MTKDGKTKDIFFGIVAIATLIVAIIGATLAYFSITASSNEGVINATSATVSIQYNDGKQVTAQADELIPADFDTIVKKSYETYIKNLKNNGEINASTNRCTDSYGQQVCSAYRFSITTDEKRTITATLNNEYNGFEYLHYALYDITNGTWLEQSSDEFEKLTKCDNKNNEDPAVKEEDDCYEIKDSEKIYLSKATNSLFGKEMTADGPVNAGLTVNIGTHEYDLVLFIQENDKNQNIDQGKQYSGTIKIDVDVNGENGQITGRID